MDNKKIDNKKSIDRLKSLSSASAQASFKKAFRTGQDVATAARKRRQTEVSALAKIKTRF
jgi:hypothetical protein